MKSNPQFLRRYITDLGRGRVVIITTLVTLFLTLTFVLIFETCLNRIGISVNPIAAVFITTCVTLITTPIMCWHFVGLIIKIHRLEEEMRSLATCDTLTGLLNRGEFLRRVENYHKLEKKEGLEFSLVIMDIDNFKNINDQYGHISGDIVLESFANAVRTSIRDSDLVSRFGGDEFVFFLPNTPSEQARMFAERLHSKIRTPVEVDGLQIRYTASMGLATCPDEFTINIDYVIGMADKALYHAKNMGGNQTQFFNANPNSIDWETKNKQSNIFKRLSEVNVSTS